jgi:hypothetical protein
VICHQLPSNTISVSALLLFPSRVDIEKSRCGTGECGTQHGYFDVGGCLAPASWIECDIDGLRCRRYFYIREEILLGLEINHFLPCMGAA